MPLRLYRRGALWWMRGTLFGRRVNRSTKLAKKADADTIRTDFENEALQRHLVGSAEALTFAEAVTLYLADGKDHRFVNELLEHFKKTPVREITGPMVRAAARKLYAGKSFPTWNRQVVGPARAIINHAADMGKCRPIRVRHFKAKEDDVVQPPPYEPVAVDRAWIDAFRAHASNRYLAALALFMFQSATRVGEATMIEPAHLRLNQRRILSPAELAKNGEPAEIQLTMEMVVELANLPPRNGKVFGYASRHSVYGPWATTCTRAKIPYVPPHQAGRHSFATEMIVRHGKDVVTTADLGRWKSKRLLLDRYPHSERLVETLDDVFAPPVHHGTSGAILNPKETKAK